MIFESQSLVTVTFELSRKGEADFPERGDGIRRTLEHILPKPKGSSNYSKVSFIKAGEIEVAEKLRNGEERSGNSFMVARKLLCRLVTHCTGLKGAKVSKVISALWHFMNPTFHKYAEFLALLETMSVQRKLSDSVCEAKSRSAIRNIQCASLLHKPDTFFEVTSTDGSKFTQKLYKNIVTTGRIRFMSEKKSRKPYDKKAIVNKKRLRSSNEGIVLKKFYSPYGFEGEDLFMCPQELKQSLTNETSASYGNAISVNHYNTYLLEALGDNT